jgi:hypothetical protein
MVRRPLHRLALGAAFALPSLALATTLPAGLSGSWYNPAQSGHGLSIQMLSPSRALVFWYATDPHGNPFNLYVDAEVEPSSLVGRAIAPSGLRFGEWNRADLRAPAWGEVRIEFVDCDHASLSWTPDGEAGAAFAPGSMPLRRLTRIEGLRCEFPAAEAGTSPPASPRVDGPAATRTVAERES